MNENIINNNNICPRLVKNGFGILRFHPMENEMKKANEIFQRMEVFDTVCSLLDTYYSRLQQRLEYENLYLRCQKLLNIVQQRADKVLFEFQNKLIDSK